MQQTILFFLGCVRKNESFKHSPYLGCLHEFMATLKISTILASLLTLSDAFDFISPSQTINDSQTLTSSSGVFQLGFFTPGTSSFRYVGIWYNNKISPRRIVWVANRQSPITTTTGVLHLTSSGNLAISDNTKTLIWSTNTTSATSARLLSTGNLVVYSGPSILWQGFDHPTDTILPGMKIGRNFISNIQSTLSSWTSDSDPSPGDYTFTVYVQNHRPPEGYIMNGSTPIWRSGTWDGDGWNGLPAMTANAYFDYNLINNATEVRGNAYFDYNLIYNASEVYFTFELKNPSTESMVVLGQNGLIQTLVCLGTVWNNYGNVIPTDPCDSYGFCGNFGVCRNSGAPTVKCECLRGFAPEPGAKWGLREWTGGCKRKLELGCGKGDVFVKVEHMKLPDTVNARSDHRKGIDECVDWCLRNCSCLGYAVTTVDGGGCINWFGDLMDMRDFVSGGEDLYLRLAASELDVAGTNGTSSIVKGSHSKKSSVVIFTVAVVSGMTLVSVALFIVCMRQRKGQRILKQSRFPVASTSLFVAKEFDSCNLSNILTKDHELPSFPFSIIATSTNNFSYETKIGEGGFGLVHKGTLPNGQQIAVKRLSKRSSQGVNEFKNEIKLIANLQHKNLVRLLGCSIKDNERLLVYEYMANGSLDKFLFDPIKAVHLDWQRRIVIIHGIAQGLLYLHKYSRLRIIHRDMKCSNILLDADMNPKISDFGIARIFGGNQDHENTIRVVGTYGYMPPEYAIKGLFSEKSDAFSYGVLLLEIISGKKNNNFDQFGALLGRAWELWNIGRVSELMDPVLGQSCPLPELTRLVQVGLLCVQVEPDERPNMSSVVSYLSSNTTALPSPGNVAFIPSRGMNVYSSSTESYGTPNEVTITAVEPR